jgi:hypothetical protein
MDNNQIYHFVKVKTKGDEDSKGTMRIYPGEGDPFCTWITKEPLIEFKINLNEWAERVTNNKSTIKITQL